MKALRGYLRPGAAPAIPAPAAPCPDERLVAHKSTDYRRLPSGSGAEEGRVSNPGSAPHTPT